MAELDALNEKIHARIRSMPTSPDAFAPEQDEFKALLAKYDGETSDDVAGINLVYAFFLEQVMRDADGALTQLNHVIETYPDTPAARQALMTLDGLNEKQAREAAEAGLIGQAAPELDFDWVSRPGLAHLSDLKGKVVVLDFWATWCGPCISSFPQVAKLAAHYDESIVEVIGVTSLQGRVHGLEAGRINTQGEPEREYELTAQFGEKHNVTWTVAFSAQKVFNDDYYVSGIPHMTIIAPDGTVRHNGLHPAEPHAKKVALIDEILTEFDLPVPTSSDI
jgi:thiol-disulfide isomerase/thioredoxin